jgi:hypothetical protein
MTRTSRLAATLAACLLGIATPVLAADIVVTTDTPFTFRATFTGVDTDASTIGGSDYQTWTFDYWTVLLNLRVDSINADTGVATGFYEIQLTHSGSALPNPGAPVVKAFLINFPLQPGVLLTDTSVSSGLHGGGSDYLSTTVDVLFQGNTGSYSGSIAGDTDLDGDGILDAKDATDEVVETLKVLKDVGVITGKEMGQIIKQTKRPRD